MKKILAFIICILIFASLIACEKEKSPEGEQSKSATALILNNSDDESDGGNPSPNTQTLAHQAFVAALNNELTIRYSVSNSSGTSDIYLKDIMYTPTSSTLTHATVDMDGDGTDEMVLRYGNTKILLKYDNGIVYGFYFSSSAMENIYSNGSFSWSYYGDQNSYGLSRISFANGKLKIRELCRYDYDGNYTYYIGGAEVTYEEYWDYREQNTNESVPFTSLDISLLDEGKAIAIASEKLGISEGDFDEETGYRYHFNAYKFGNSYHVELSWFVANEAHYQTLKCVLVDISTGEISPCNEPHAKG
ncbi:MAG: hypothetical protein J6A83_03000 [Clostridia bacterium]|nr:hypothetical protein [Clostridia bacterium]